MGSVVKMKQHHPLRVGKYFHLLLAFTTHTHTCLMLYAMYSPCGLPHPSHTHAFHLLCHYLTSFSPFLKKHLLCLPCLSCAPALHACLLTTSVYPLGLNMCIMTAWPVACPTSCCRHFPIPVPSPRPSRFLYPTSPIRRWALLCLPLVVSCGDIWHSCCYLSMNTRHRYSPMPPLLPTSPTMPGDRRLGRLWAGFGGYHALPSRCVFQPLHLLALFYTTCLFCPTRALTKAFDFSATACRCVVVSSRIYQAAPFHTMNSSA